MPIVREDPPPTPRERDRDQLAALVAELRAVNDVGHFYRLATFPTDPTGRLRLLFELYRDIEFESGRKIPTGPDRGQFGLWGRLR